jgi:hypothetical protein
VAACFGVVADSGRSATTTFRMLGVRACIDDYGKYDIVVFDKNVANDVADGCGL